MRLSCKVSFQVEKKVTGGFEDGSGAKLIEYRITDVKAFDGESTVLQIFNGKVAHVGGRPPGRRYSASQRSNRIRKRNQ